MLAVPTSSPRSGTSWSQEAKLTASDAAADDRFGYAVAIYRDSVVVGSYRDDDAGDDSGSAYVFFRSGTSWSQQDKLTASDAAVDDFFGRSVAISEDSIVVGAYWDDDGGSASGSAYVFTRNGASWSQQDKLTASDAAVEDYFGFSVAIDRDSVIVGAYQDDDGGLSSGSAYVFTRSGASWSQQSKLTAGDAAPGDWFGRAVAISGDSVVVGASFDDDGASDSGSAYVFSRSGTSWSQQAKLTASDAAAADYFGSSVAISHDSIVVGAPSDNDGGVSSGSAYIFTRSGTTWSQQAKLNAGDASQLDLFGSSVAISGDSVVVGAHLDNDGYIDSGSAYVFTRSGTSWSQQAKLTPNYTAEDDFFGRSVAISGDSVVVGAYGDDEGGSASGSAYVFTRNGSSWSQQDMLTANDAAAGDYFGWSVAISGDSVVVGAHRDDDSGSASGSAYVFTRSGASWSQQDKLSAWEAAAEDNFGYSVAISGDSVIVGAHQNDDDGSSSGSAYVFTRSGTSWVSQAKLTASDAAVSDFFGWSVAISGDSVVVGAYGDDDGGSQTGSVYIYRFAVAGERLLQVHDSFGTQVVHSSSAPTFAGQLLGTSRAYTFRLSNAGHQALDLQSITLGGANLSEFSLSFLNLNSPTDLGAGQSYDLTITFSPSGVSSSMRNAALVIFSNDSNTPVFSFNISGLGLSNSTDGDSDGMNDWAEYSLRGFGFDWTMSQPNEVNDYYDLASTAGLFTESELAAVNVSASLVKVDPVANTAAIVIGLEESDDLETYNPIIAELSKITIDGEGRIRYEVDTSPDKKFIRVGVGE